ncbi:carotenoid cleavage dioxygenase [Herbihabitans rhizosphaerae]|uniref:Dioxygenase n=1 Tax=Herbihabitans rhizosphaerae TaxID=1872711 RepID=A0A4Q7L5P1_9PSEU|nr:carotenoid oxygenase family protein [Herbihabitans rhizosphaerae]RZS44958.1 carotenoid cleavage dioxygenase [Herbihabitans rhizosphaerae]
MVLTDNGSTSVHSGRLPFMVGGFEPVREEITAFDLPVTGRVPEALNGRYLRNGPNALGLEDPIAYHWMLGDGMVHGVRLRDGRAEWYRNRWVRPAAGHFACNIHVIGHGGRILALQEAGPPPYELDGELNTVGAYDFGGTLDGAFTAHTKYDPFADELHAITYLPMAYVRHVVIDGSGRVARSTELPITGSPFLHDFALTEKHVVVFDSPVTFDPTAPPPVPFVWNEERPARIGVLPRQGGEIRWFELDPIFYSHTLNAYDDGSSVVVDVTTFPAPFHAAGFGDGGPAASGPPSLRRWRIDLEHGQVRTEYVDDRPQEFPRLNESLVTRRHRYGYSAQSAEMFHTYRAVADDAPPDHVFTNALIKQDLDRRDTEVHRFARDAATSEPVFVPAGPGAAEDDGYVLSYVHDPERGASDLVILSAQDFTAEPLATVHLPARVPLGFHGSWIPDA